MVFGELVIALHVPQRYPWKTDLQMIDDPLPADWKELQEGVRRIFRNVGLSASVEVDVKTPRGSVNIDVVAIDERSVDKIKYIVECKNWSTAIPQAVVHSFTTVMHETGANIGFIISKHGLQSGAEQYTQSTNIVGMTYLQFQQRYFAVWWNRYFCARVGDAADRVLDYVEEYNPRRDEEVAKLSPEDQVKFNDIRRVDGGTVMILSFFNHRVMSPLVGKGSLLNPPVDLDSFKVEVLSTIAPHVQWHCSNFRGLLDILLLYLSDVEKAFIQLLGQQLCDRQPLTQVDIDGPPLVES